MRLSLRLADIMPNPRRGEPSITGHHHPVACLLSCECRRSSTAFPPASTRAPGGQQSAALNFVRPARGCSPPRTGDHRIGVQQWRASDDTRSTVDIFSAGARALLLVVCSWCRSGGGTWPPMRRTQALPRPVPMVLRLGDSGAPSPVTALPLRFRLCVETPRGHTAEEADLYRPRPITASPHYHRRRRHHPSPSPVVISRLAPSQTVTLTLRPPGDPVA